MKPAKYFVVAILLLASIVACNKSKNTQVEAKQISSYEEPGFNKDENKKEDKLTQNKSGNYNTTDSAGSPVYNNDEGKEKDNTNNKPIKQEPTKVVTDWNKKIIKIANVTLDVNDYNKFNKNIHELVKRYGAYVSGEEQNQNSYSIENNIVIKVPVEQFDDLMNSLSGDGISVIERKITTEDVTNEIIDTRGRIEAKKAVRQQYISLLNQAKNMEDILQVQNEINRITEELESATGRVNYLTHQSTFSTIHLKYYQYFDASAKPETQPSFLSKIKNAFVSGAEGVGNFLVLLINLWPLFAIAFAVWLAYKKWIKQNNKNVKITE